MEIQERERIDNVHLHLYYKYRKMIKNSPHQFLVIMLLVLMSSCQFLRLSSKKEFNEGVYSSKSDHKKVYVVPSEESITVYSLKDNNKDNVDTGKFYKVDYPDGNSHVKYQAYSFRKPTFDLGAISVLFKIRPTVHGFPPQMNTAFNGSVYLGLRTDIYKLKYRETPLHVYKKTQSHLGYSFGVFTGLGTELVNEFNTESGITIEYDGIVNLSGVVAIVGINNLTLGLALGVDHLLDKNKTIWIYTGKPWVGLSVGLNLN